MNRFILIIFLGCMLAACKKEYTYEEYHFKNGLLQTEASVLKAKNDTLAYIEAFRKFCSTLATEEFLRKNISNPTSNAVGFGLLNPDGTDLVWSIDFKTKEREEIVLKSLLIGNETEAERKLEHFQNSKKKQ